MSDELIVIPSFLKGAASVSATAACAYCGEIVLENGCHATEDCYEVCPAGRLGVCSDDCEGGENACKYPCEYACTSMQGGSSGCGECDACMAANQGTASECRIYINSAWRTAVPYIHDGSGWKQASEKLWTS